MASSLTIGVEILGEMKSKLGNDAFDAIVNQYTKPPLVYEEYAEQIILDIRSAEPRNIILVAGSAFLFFGKHRDTFFQELAKSSLRGCSVGVVFSSPESVTDEKDYITQNITTLRNKGFTHIVFSPSMLPGSMVVVENRLLKFMRSFSKPLEERWVTYTDYQGDVDSFVEDQMDLFSSFVLCHLRNRQ